MKAKLLIVMLGIVGNVNADFITVRISSVRNFSHISDISTRKAIESGTIKYIYAFYLNGCGVVK